METKDAVKVERDAMIIPPFYHTFKSLWTGPVPLQKLELVSIYIEKSCWSARDTNKAIAVDEVAQINTVWLALIK